MIAGSRSKFLSGVLNFCLLALVLLFVAETQLNCAQNRPRRVAGNLKTIAVRAGEDFQAALNDAQCGDQITLAAGATWDAKPNTPFTFPNKGCSASNPIKVQSSAASSLPNGRVSPENASNMALVRARGNSAIRFAPGAAFWIIDGLEITNTGTDGEFVSTLIDGIDESCHDVTIQRSYIHPRETGTDYSRSVNRAIYFNGYNLLLKWNHASGFMGVSTTDGGLMTSAVLLTIKGHHITVEDNFLEAWYTSIFTGGGQTKPEYTATLSNATMNSATFSDVKGLRVGMVVRFELRGTGNLSGNILTRTAGEVLDQNDVTVGPGANAVWLTPARGNSDTVYRFGLSAVNGNNYTLSAFNGGSQNGPYNWVCFQVAMVTSISGTTVNYTPYGVNQLRHNPTMPGQAVWRATPMVHNLTIVRNTFNIDVANAEYTHSTRKENPKGWWEFKDGTDILIEGNRFTGYPSVMGMVPRSDEGATPWSTMNRITIKNNLFDLTPEPEGAREWFIAAGDDNYNSSTPGGNFTITNNLVINVNSLGFMRAFRNSSITHNTIINSPNAVYGSKALQSDLNNNTGLQFRNNIFGNNEYGMNCLLPGGLATCWPAIVFQKNVIVDNRNIGNLTANYGAGILRPIKSSYSQVGFADMASTDYRLAPNSPYKGTASDGTDPGVNMDALLAALKGSPKVETNAR